jgi:(1->4)-alpha-D-glucan 1-alpha-D-glucosylmutase
LRAEQGPQTLLATATHDHKRGEETRARLLALAEWPDEWHGVAGELVQVGRRHVPDDEDDARPPHPADAYLFYQILAALWPERDADDGAGNHPDSGDLTERLVAYMEKACRESKRETRWIAPDEAYEHGVDAFVRGLAGDPATADALRAFSERLAADGFVNGLTQLALKCLTPGVPDFYQGRELPDDSLVDPDNRRPVDYDRRRALLDETTGADAPDAETLRRWTQEQDERAKFVFAARLLALRREHPALLRAGGYRRLDVHPAEHGPEGADDVWIAFARRHQGEAMIAALPRFPRRRRAGTAATLALPDALAGRAFTDALTGETVRPGEDGTLALHEQPLPWVVLVASGS